MNTTLKNIYYISAIDSLINGKNSTDLFDYEMEYIVEPDDIASKLFEDQNDGTLAIKVRIKDKKTNKVVWGYIYHKILLKNTSKNDPELKEEFNKIINATDEQKASFIFKSERKIIKKPYTRSFFVNPTDYFDDLRHSSFDGFPVVSLGGKVPDKLNSILNKIAIEKLETLSKTLGKELNVSKRNK